MRAKGQTQNASQIGFAIAGKSMIIGAPFIWLFVFFFLPFLITLGISFSTKQFGQPPFVPLLSTSETGAIQLHFSLSNYLRLISDSLYINAFGTSIFIAAMATVLTLLIAFPLAYFIAQQKSPWREILILLVILPFWTSFLLRIYALTQLLRTQGVINQILQLVGLEPVPMMHTDFAVYFGIIYMYLPFMVLPIYANLTRLPKSQVEASADLGARPFQTFWFVILPHAKSGIIAGCLLVFLPALGEFIIPAILGGPETLMIGRVLWDEFFANTNWPRASALAISLLFIMAVPAFFALRFSDDRRRSR